MLKYRQKGDVSMDILISLNKAMDYIEKNICEDIDIDKVAKATNYSSYHFCKIFSYLTDMSLSEYIRRRKMTLAGIELQNTDSKVIDIAIKYGYDNPDSFSRAFSKLHNVTPSQAKIRGCVLKTYPKLSFQISVKGELSMDYKIEDMEAFDVIGVKKRFKTEPQPGDQTIPEFWTELRQNGKLAEIMQYSNGKFNEAVGICTNGDSKGLDYFVAIPTSINTAPDGLEIFHFLKNTYGIFHFIGPLHETMPKAEKMIFAEWLPTSGYEPVDAADMEVYSSKPHDAKDYEFWVYVPIKKK